MARQYEYKARDATGQLFSGMILADDEAGVAGHIRAKGLFVTKIKLAKASLDIGVIFQNRRKISTRDLAIFCRQFATMLEAGMPILNCLGVMAEQTENPRLKQNLQTVYKNVQEGMALARALEEQKGIFPDIMTSMVAAGELGGVLDDVMLRLSIHFEKEHRLNEKVKAAMVYPAVVMAMAVIVVVFVLTFILPTFVGMFASMKVELPLLTRGLLAVSGFLTSYWWLLLLIGLVVGIGVNWGLQKTAGKELRDQIILKLPVFGPLVKKVAIARFTRTLASLLRGGVPLLSALDVVKSSTGNVVVSNALSASQASIKEGEDLSTRLGSSKIFPPMVVQMVAVGEESGQLDKMLDKVADFYEEDAQDLVERLSSLLEPFLIAFLGVTIGTIVISILLPMFDVIGNMNK